MEIYGKKINKEHLIMLIMAGSIVVFNFIGFIICYFVWNEYKKESDYIAFNGKNLLNFHISFFIYEIVAFISMIVLVGFILVPIISIAYFILAIIGMVKYGTYENYEYPFVIDFIK